MKVGGGNRFGLVLLLNWNEVNGVVLRASCAKANRILINNETQYLETPDVTAPELKSRKGSSNSPLGGPRCSPWFFRRAPV